MKPIEIAQLIFEASKRKNWKVSQAFCEDAWVTNCLGQLLHHGTFHAIRRPLDANLKHAPCDDIVWRLTPNGQYSAKSAYDLQFIGTTLSSLDKTIWKAWAPPKVKFFVWLANQNRIWMANQLEKRGWLNCGLCPPL
jgi:hypothetical protein